MEKSLQSATDLPKSERDVPHITLPDWEPHILVFACHFCAFAAADLAGVMRLSYSPNVRIIRLPCSGKIDHIYVLRAFERGVDGVFVAG
jgi:hypothetical protein